MKSGIVFILCAALAGTAGAYGVEMGGAITEENEFHKECFTTEWTPEGIHGEPVDCAKGYDIDGEGYFIDHATLAYYDEPIEGGDVVKVYWTHQQAEQGDWMTPAKIERNDGK